MYSRAAAARILGVRFQFLGIPPKGEPQGQETSTYITLPILFPISRDPPEGGTGVGDADVKAKSNLVFPISRDPPEGGTRGESPR